MTALELINKAREDNDFDVIGAINVKEYLPINEKREIINLTIARCSEYEEGNILLNGVELYIIFHIKFIEAYTDIEFTDTYYDDYDALTANGLLDMIINAALPEYNRMTEMLILQKEYVLAQNSLEAQVGRFLGDLSYQFGKFVDNIGEKVSGLNLEDVNVNQDDVNKILQFVNKIKK